MYVLYEFPETTSQLKFLPNRAIWVLSDYSLIVQFNITNHRPHVINQKENNSSCHIKQTKLNTNIHICTHTHTAMQTQSSSTKNKKSTIYKQMKHGLLFHAKLSWGNFLTVQWLGLCGLTAKHQGSNLVQGTEIPQATCCRQTNKQKI